MEIDFQDDSRGGHVGFPIRTILANFFFKSPRYFLSSFESTDLSIEKYFEIEFHHSSHLGFQM